jgi:hypothetical protein
MADIVNLNRVRKAKSKAEATRQAAENRIIHGRTRAEREREAQENEARRRALEGKRLTPDEPKD